MVKTRSRSDPFDLYLQLPVEELVWEIPESVVLPESDLEYLVNPRRLRGSDFLMRWSQGRWSEEIVMRALNQTAEFGVIPYGPSTVAPDDPKELEYFFETMEIIEREGKRPDLLLYRRQELAQVRQEIEQRWGGLDRIPQTPSSEIGSIIAKAVAALEIENSLWVTSQMPGFGKPFGKYIRGKNKGRLKPAGIIPTIIVKGEDIPRLKQWEARFHTPIYVVHIFFDRGFFVRFDEILRLLRSRRLGYDIQKFSNPDGTVSTPKRIVKVPYILCKEFGLVSNPTLSPKTFVDRNGKVMTYVTFSGGDIRLAEQVFEEWLK
jgi:hypothetical protein